MLEKKFPFCFSLDNLIHSENFLNFCCNFFITHINQKYIFMGHCPKNLSKSYLEQNIDNIKDFEYFWNNREINQIDNFLREKKYSRLFEWLSVRILLKIGLPLYWKFVSTNLNVSQKNIVLSKNKWNKPFINIISESNFDYIPFISISHSKKDIFIALSSLPIGIDCEQISSYSINLINKIFTEQELTKFLNNFGKKIKISDEMIYTLMYSLKEATLKLITNSSIGMISKISIQLLNDSILTKYHNNCQNYKGFISLIEDSVLTVVM
ncbi:MAG: 4'-phosphopantetheinyl transferase family protein [Promethearchaeota archaeon]